MKARMPSRRVLVWGGVSAVILVALVFGFRPAPVLVDTAEVERARFELAVEDEGRTRIADRYQVFAPAAGRISRITLEPGDAVRAGEPLFMLDPATLDVRTEAQAEATLARAEAALAAAREQVEAQQARAELAESELARIGPLVEAGHMPRDALERARAEARSASAGLRSARFAVEVARHERDNARALVAMANGERTVMPMTVRSPVEGVVLQRARQSEGPVQAGEPVLEIGNLDSLEVEVDVLSPDAVRLRPGMRVEIERWGGDAALPGRVTRIEPAGFTRISALGVEEQRVWVIVALDAPRDVWAALGDRYRVEARFILWEGDRVLQAPASAVFRHDGGWAVFVVENGRAAKRSVRTGRRSGLAMEILEGLEPGERVVLHPGADIADGTRIRLR